MSLQVKLRHPLGEKLIELEPRTSEDPVVIGRQVGAQIQVPSVSVSPRHSVMFVYEGRWVVQDSGETTGTFVNGQPIEGAVFLQVGDVIKLGAEPRSPTITVDPHGAAEGRTGNALANAGAVRTVASPPRPVGAARPVGGGYGAPAGYAPPRSPYGTAAVATPVAEAVTEEDGDSIAWPTDSGSSQTASGSTLLKRPKKSSSDAPMMIAIGVGIVIVTGTIWAVYVKMHPDQPAVPVQKVPVVQKTEKTAKVVKDNSHASGSIFDGGLVDPSARNTPDLPTAKSLPVIKGNLTELAVAFGPGKRSTASLPIPKAKNGETDDSGKPAAPVIDENDKRFKAPEWKNLESMRWGPDHLKALLAYEDYEQNHPGQLTAQVNLLREATLDTLWFSRIEQLWNKREKIADELKKLEEAIKEQPDGPFKTNTLLPEKQTQQKKLNAASEMMVKEMGYSASSPPDVTDDAQLDELRKLRDRDYYSQWKKRVLNTVHRQRTLPWVD